MNEHDPNPTLEHELPSLVPSLYVSLLYVIFIAVWLRVLAYIFFLSNWRDSKRERLTYIYPYCHNQTNLLLLSIDR
jgi:hypothetical protein